MDAQYEILYYQIHFKVFGKLETIEDNNLIITANNASVNCNN